VIVQLYTPATLPPGKEPPLAIQYEAGWAPRPGLVMVVRRKNLSPCQESECKK